MQNLLNRQNHNMPESIYQEMREHLIEYIYFNYFINGDDYKEKVRDAHDLHHDVFNSDYYIIGYYNAQKWLEKHGVDTLEALAFVSYKNEYEFGESLNTDDMNYERLVNLVTYWIGEEIIQEFTEQKMEDAIQEYHKEYKEKVK